MRHTFDVIDYVFFLVFCGLVLYIRFSSIKEEHEDAIASRLMKQTDSDNKQLKEDQ